MLSSTVSPDQENATIDVVAGDHAEIAVRGLARMHEIGWRAGGRERGRHFQPDMAALAHAGNDDPAVAGAQDLHRLGEAVDQLGGERCMQGIQPCDFGLQGPRRRRKRLAAVVAQQAIALKADGHVPASPVVRFDFSTDFGACQGQTDPFWGAG